MMSRRRHESLLPPLTVHPSPPLVPASACHRGCARSPQSRSREHGNTVDAGDRRWTADAHNALSRWAFLGRRLYGVMLPVFPAPLGDRRYTAYRERYPVVEGEGGSRKGKPQTGDFDELPASDARREGPLTMGGSTPCRKCGRRACICIASQNRQQAHPPACVP